MDVTNKPARNPDSAIMLVSWRWRWGRINIPNLEEEEEEDVLKHLVTEYHGVKFSFFNFNSFQEKINF